MSQPTFLRPHPPNLLRVTESQAFSSSSSLVSSAPSSVFDRISRATSGYLTDATPPITPSTSGVVQDGIKGDIGSLRLPETPLKQQLLPDRLRHAGNVHGHKSGSTPRLRSLIASGEDLGYASDKEDSPHDAVAILRSRLARGKSTLAARRALRIMAARSSACPANDSQSPLSAGSDTSVHKMTVMVTQPKSPVDEWSSDLELQATKAPMHGEPTEDNSIAVNGGLQATTESQTPENDLADNFPSPQVPEETPPSDENVVKKFGVDKSLDDDNWSLETELDSAEILQICFGTPEAITPETRDVVDEFLPYDLEGLSIGSYEMFSGNTLALLKDTIPGSPQIEKGSSVLDFLPAPVPYVMPCKPRLRGIPLDDAACSPLALSSSPSWKLNWTSSPVVYSPLVLNPAKMPILGDVLGLVGQMTSPTRPPFRWVMGRPFVEKDLLGAVSLNSPDHASKFSSSDNHTPGISRAPRTPIGLGFAMPLTYPPLPLTLFPNQPHPDSNSSPLDAEDQMIESQILEIEQTFSGVLSKKDLQSPRNLSSKEHSGKDHEHVIEIPIQHTSSPKLANAHNFEDNVELENAVLANSSLYHPTPARPGQFFVGLDLEGSKRMTMALSPLPRPSRHPIQDLENGAIHQGYQKLLSHVVVPSQQIDIEKLTTESEIEPSGVLSESEVECELLDHSQKSSVLITNKDCIEMSSSLSKTGLGIEGLTIAVPCRALRREEIGSLPSSVDSDTFGSPDNIGELTIGLPTSTFLDSKAAFAGPCRSGSSCSESQ
ncbi:hypothetical protein B0H34DRAFT_678660 [Crassisporium funariophilum]|nr:hypothetical protein B0H34DRAFT_678660 [Crassisporium funariophilum]